MRILPPDGKLRIHRVLFQKSTKTCTLIHPLSSSLENKHTYTRKHRYFSKLRQHCIHSTWDTGNINYIKEGYLVQKKHSIRAALYTTPQTYPHLLSTSHISISYLFPTLRYQSSNSGWYNAAVLQKSSSKFDEQVKLTVLCRHLHFPTHLKYRRRNTDTALYSIILFNCSLLPTRKVLFLSLTSYFTAQRDTTKRTLTERSDTALKSTKPAIKTHHNIWFFIIILKIFLLLSYCVPFSSLSLSVYTLRPPCLALVSRTRAAGLWAVCPSDSKARSCHWAPQLHRPPVASEPLFSSALTQQTAAGRAAYKHAGC